MRLSLQQEEVQFPGKSEQLQHLTYPRLEFFQVRSGAAGGGAKSRAYLPRGILIVFLRLAGCDPQVPPVIASEFVQS